MKPNFFNQFQFKIMAGQLRRPHGFLAKKVADKMNVSNGVLYDFVLETMKVSDNDSILEIGFGNGKFFDRIFSKASGLKISGLDFSKKMVAEATTNNRESIAKKTLDLHFGSSDSMPFRNNTFDHVFCINVVYFWEDPDKHLQEIFRVLKPTGKLYTVLRTSESMLKMPFVKYGFKVYAKEEWITVLERNGFHILETPLKKEVRVDHTGNQFNHEAICYAVEKMPV